MEDWIIIVDDDTISLKLAGSFLSKAGKRVTALNSGAELLEYVRAYGCPDLILLDIYMPGMDGLETFRRLKEQLPQDREVPVIFLSWDESDGAEIKGLESGAMDFIRKPFSPDVLLNRVQRALDIHHRITQYEHDAETDKMTGILNRAAVEAAMKNLCLTESGFLCITDLDSFKAVNDIYGHEVGDQVLVLFAELLKQHSRPGDVCGRIGGDEFIYFGKNMTDKDELESMVHSLSEQFHLGALEIIGGQMPIPLGVSIGAVSVPEYGRDYTSLFHMADQALYFVKQNGKHGYRLYTEDLDQTDDGQINLKTVTTILEEKDQSPNALWMGREVFGSIYRYMIRYMDRYHSMAYQVLFTITFLEEVTSVEHTETMMQFRNMLQLSLRNSDVMMECGDSQLFLLLPEIREYDIERVVSRLVRKWYEQEHSKKTKVVYEYSEVRLKSQEQAEVHPGAFSDWIALTDDDAELAKALSRALEQQNVHVSVFRSGQELLDMVKENPPRLILLEANMPEMNGFDVLTRLRKDRKTKQLPVVFLIDDNDSTSELHCLELGAADCIRKSSPEIFALRVRRILEVLQLQRNLTEAVERKTRDNERMSLKVLYTLAKIIDGKDRSSNDHSPRVAEYAREIARRAGYNIGQQDDIYMVALLHDIGKINISEDIFNKPGPLTEEEYDEIKAHTIFGADILGEIDGMPKLERGARWHHERFDGSGYPDGLAGTDIPEEARIIAVADAYDAMTSARSYRDPLTQEQVRKELTNGMGTQFDPRFAQIMLEMMDEDPEFRMRENP
ncbi:MAG: response regulator [Clostridia bacterium]|nr:response regulator [Clostridia bacterium]